jgi:hypothetical protein
MGKNQNIRKRSLLDDVSTDFKSKFECTTNTDHDPGVKIEGNPDSVNLMNPDSVNLMNPDPFLTDGWRGQEDWEYEEEYAEEYAVCSLEDMLALLQSDDEVLKETFSRDE